MTRSETRRWFAAAVVFCATAGGAAAQVAPLVPPFPSAVISRQWDAEGDLRASSSRDGGELSITARIIAGRDAVESGWAGACVENHTTVSLQNFTHATAIIESSARVVMDIKLERPKFADGTLLLEDHGSVGAGSKRFSWNLKTADEHGTGTMRQTKRMCFYVLADDFPAGHSEVIVRISRVRFERH